MLAAFSAIGAGWHHHRWSDLRCRRSGLERHRNATASVGPRRGERGSRITTPEGGVRLRYRRRGKGDDPVRARHHVDQRRPALAQRLGPSDRGRHGRRSEIRAGQAVEAAGQIATIAPPLNPGEFDYRAFLQAQGIRLRLTIDDPESFWPDPSGTDRPFTLWLDSHRHRIRTWLFERSIRRPLRWPRPCCWAGAKRSIPRSTMRSLEPARPTCWPSPGFSCKRSPLRSCSSFAWSAYRAGRLI